MKPDFQTWFETNNPDGAVPETAMHLRVHLERAYVSGADTMAKNFVQVGQLLQDVDKLSFTPFVDALGVTLKPGDPVYVLRDGPVGKTVLELKQELACERLELAIAKANERKLEDMVLELGRQLDELAVKTGEIESPYNTNRLLCELQNRRILHNGFNLHGTRTGRFTTSEQNDSNTPKSHVEEVPRDR